MSKLPLLTLNQFKYAITKGPVLIEFCAPWCGPCNALEPLLLQLCKELRGRIGVAKIDVEANPDLAAEFSIILVPTVILFKDEGLVARRSGRMGLDDLRAFVDMEV